MPTKKEGGRALHYDISNPDDMKEAVLNGLIWIGGEYVQDGIDYIEAGNVKLADCKNMPDDIRSLLESK